MNDGEPLLVWREPGLDLGQVGRDQGAGVRVDGEPPILVGLGVLTDALAATTT